MLVFVEIAKMSGTNRKSLIDVTGLAVSTMYRVLKVLTSEPFCLVEYKGSRKTGGYILTERGLNYDKALKK